MSLGPDPSIPPKVRQFADRVFDLSQTTRVPLTDQADVFLSEVTAMLDYALARNNPTELAELRRLIGDFSKACACLVAPERVYRSNYH